MQYYCICLENNNQLTQMLDHTTAWTNNLNPSKNKA